MVSKQRPSAFIELSVEGRQCSVHLTKPALHIESQKSILAISACQTLTLVRFKPTASFKVAALAHNGPPPVKVVLVSSLEGFRICGRGPRSKRGFRGAPPNGSAGE
jgi:hypothetical protein